MFFFAFIMMTSAGRGTSRRRGGLLSRTTGRYLLSLEQLGLCFDLRESFAQQNIAWDGEKESHDSRFAVRQNQMVLLFFLMITSGVNFLLIKRLLVIQ